VEYLRAQESYLMRFVTLNGPNRCVQLFCLWPSAKSLALPRVVRAEMDRATMVRGLREAEGSRSPHRDWDWACCAGRLNPLWGGDVVKATAGERWSFGEWRKHAPAG
jgi:hypothetical protein